MSSFDKFLPVTENTHPANLAMAFEAMRGGLHDLGERVDEIARELREVTEISGTVFAELRARISRIETEINAQDMFAFNLAIKAVQNCSPEAADPNERRTYEKAMLVMERCLDAALSTIAPPTEQRGEQETATPGEEAGIGGADQGDQSEALGDRAGEISAEDG